jgi:hypothetical protein
MSGRVSLGGTSTNPAAYGASTQYSSAGLYLLPSNSILRPDDLPRVCRSGDIVVTFLLSGLFLFCFTLAGVLLKLR